MSQNLRNGRPLCTVVVASALLCGSSYAYSQTAGSRLVFNMTDPAEASRWEVQFHDTRQGPSGLHDGLFRAASSSQAPVVMERAIDIDSRDYNRLIVDMRVVSSESAGGVVGSAAFLFDSNGFVLPESRMLTNTPVGTRTSVVIRLDQSVFWEGRIRRIRFDPVWGIGRADIATITLDKEPPPPPAPIFNFAHSDSSIGWMFGEFDTANGRFVSQPTTIDLDGISFATRGPVQAIQRMDLTMNANLIRSAELVLRKDNPLPTVSRLFWASPDNLAAGEDRGVTVPLQAGTGWQTVKFDLAANDRWGGPVSFLLLNPTMVEGRITVRSLSFEGVEGLGTRGEQDALVMWRTHQEVGAELTSGNYKPLLVLITMDDHPFSNNVELQLAANPEFLSRARDFHAVRLPFGDPATTRVFPDIFRIPVLATMTFDFNTRQWNIRERLMGPEVATDCIKIMDRTLAR